MLELLTCNTFWSAVGAIATAVGATAIIFAARQLRFEAWLKAQEIWVSQEFTKDRGIIFARLDKLGQNWTPEDEALALNVCRRLDEFCRLSPYLGRRRILRSWGDPLAKAWVILEPIVLKERKNTRWYTKWDAFEKFGKKALKSRQDLQAIRQNMGSGGISMPQSQDSAKMCEAASDCTPVICNSQNLI